MSMEEAAVGGSEGMDRNLALEAVRVTEAAALSAWRLMGRGDEKAADQAAVDAMRRALNSLAIDGTVVIGEGERDEAPMLYIGEKVGTGKGPKIDIALDPLEGTTITAKGSSNALAVIAMAESGGFLNAPDVYMDKIAVGAGLPDGIVDLDESPEENLRRVAEAKGAQIADIIACVLDRPRHAELIAKIRAAGARIMLISDGDVSGVISTSKPEAGVDIYMGSGGAPEGVLAAAALRCIGGQMQGRLLFRNDAERARAKHWGVTDLNRKYGLTDLASGNVMFAATGVTSGTMLQGVRRFPGGAYTHSIVMRSQSGTVREVTAHPQFGAQDRLDGLHRLTPGVLAACVASDTPVWETAEKSAVDVERSLSGRRWRVRENADRAVLALAQRSGLPEIVCRLLASRGIVEVEAAERYLSPTLRALMPDPSRLQDMDRAAERLARAVRSGETVAVFGDYDVDGATSSALVLRYLRALSVRGLSHIPDRRTEGYGPNLPALLALQQAGAGLVLTVDCGTLAHEPLTAAAAAGIEIIVVDHHAAEPHLPPAYAVVNPNRLDDTSGKGRLAAVGVVFLLLVATNRVLRKAGWFDGQSDGRREPDLMNWLDLVALGTVADVVPLEGLNRALVTQGVKVMAAGGNAGLKALAEAANVRSALDAYHLGFVLGPRVNAGGRIGRSDLGLRLLSTESPEEAALLAAEAEAHNGDRREIEASVLAAALAEIERDGSADGLVFVAGEGWHPGVIGIVAARLKDRYNRPAVCISIENGVARGSGRSVHGVGLGQAVIAAGQAGLTLGGGGHAMAAGFSADPARLSELRHFLALRIAEDQAGQGAAVVPELLIDGMLMPLGATADLVALVRRLGPFGARNAEPCFAFATVRVTQAAIVGQGHVRCTLVGGGGERLKAIAFRSAESAMGQALLQGNGRPFHVAGSLRRDEWGGPQSVQLFIEDAAPAG